MRFGKDYNTFKDEVVESGGNFIRTFKEGDTVGVILAKPESWHGYLEHYNTNPGGYSFPCTQEADCPGCTAENERMRQRNPKVLFPMLVEEKWVNVYSIGKKFAERLAKRAEKDLNREYTITRIGMDQKTDYDVESGDTVRIDFDQYEVPDMEQMLVDRYNESWGDKVEIAPKAPASEPSATPSGSSSASSTSSPEAEYTEEELRAMPPRELKKILRSENLFDKAPEEVQDADESDSIVDWMLKAVSA